MTVSIRASAGPRRATPADDDGTTLIETVVAGVVMLIAAALVTAAVLGVFGITSRVSSGVTAQSQLTTSLLRLDRQVRYAAGISLPHTTAGVPYVEILVVEPGRKTCAQLRVTQGALWERTWSSGAATVSATWSVLADGVSATTPFTRVPDSDLAGHQQLTVTLSVRSGSVSRTYSTSYTALNTNRGSTAAVCTEGT